MLLEPVIVHFPQKRTSNRITRFKANYRVDPATRTQCGLTMPFPLVGPFRDLRRRKCLTAIEAAADLTCEHLFAMLEHNAFIGSADSM